MEECIFCQIAQHDLPVHIIYEADDHLCFLAREMETYGHCLLIPKMHARDIFSVDERTLTSLVLGLKSVSNLLRDRLGATGVNVLHASGQSAGQSVGHLHFHLIPRFPDDGLDAWPAFPPHEFKHEEIINKLRT